MACLWGNPELCPSKTLKQYSPWICKFKNITRYKTKLITLAVWPNKWSFSNGKHYCSSTKGLCSTWGVPLFFRLKGSLPFVSKAWMVRASCRRWADTRQSLPAALGPPPLLVHLAPPRSGPEPGPTRPVGPTALRVSRSSPSRAAIMPWPPMPAQLSCQCHLWNAHKVSQKIYLQTLSLFLEHLPQWLFKIVLPLINVI